MSLDRVPTVAHDDVQVFEDLRGQDEVRLFLGAKTDTALMHLALAGEQLGKPKMESIACAELNRRYASKPKPEAFFATRSLVGSLYLRILPAYVIGNVVQDTAGKSIGFVYWAWQEHRKLYIHVRLPLWTGDFYKLRKASLQRGVLILGEGAPFV